MRFHTVICLAFRDKTVQKWEKPAQTCRFFRVTGALAGKISKKAVYLHL
nr:MAG TPA: hypothetical protein [Caudoviricetes sp.]